MISYLYQEGLTDKVIFEQKLKESEGSKNKKSEGKTC